MEQIVGFPSDVEHLPATTAMESPEEQLCIVRHRTSAGGTRMRLCQGFGNTCPKVTQDGRFCCEHGALRLRAACVECPAIYPSNLLLKRHAALMHSPVQAVTEPYWRSGSWTLGHIYDEAGEMLLAYLATEGPSRSQRFRILKCALGELPTADNDVM